LVNHSAQQSSSRNAWRTRIFLKVILPLEFRIAINLALKYFMLLF
jgi:hypothetical protein